MIALDTSVVVRLLVNDDRGQVQRAAALLAKEPVLITATVLLEAEWVLRYTYRLDTKAIDRAFRMLLGMANVTTPDPARIAKALDWYAHGLDFADALHLTESDGATKLATFDRPFIGAAARVKASPPVVEVP